MDTNIHQLIIEKEKCFITYKSSHFYKFYLFKIVWEFKIYFVCFIFRKVTKTTSNNFSVSFQSNVACTQFSHLFVLVDFEFFGHRSVQTKTKTSKRVVHGVFNRIHTTPKSLGSIDYELIWMTIQEFFLCWWFNSNITHVKHSQKKSTAIMTIVFHFFPIWVSVWNNFFSLMM